MDAFQFIQRIEAAGFHMEVEGDGIAISPFSRLTDPQRQFIRQHKPELISALLGKAPMPDPATGNYQSAEDGPDALSVADLRVIQTASGIMNERNRARLDAGMVFDDGEWITTPEWEARQAAITPEPPPVATPSSNRAAVAVVGGYGVRCADCQHQEPTQHTALIRCGVGRQAPGACGLWWSLDKRDCPSFTPSTSAEPLTGEYISRDDPRGRPKSPLVEQAEALVAQAIAIHAKHSWSAE